MASIPSILVEFIQRATSLIARSERGIATLIIRDDTNEEFDIKKYTSIPEADADSALCAVHDLCRAHRHRGHAGRRAGHH